MARGVVGHDQRWARDSRLVRARLWPAVGHLLVQGSAPHRDHVDLRDDLRAHPDDVRRYAAEERRLAQLLRSDRDAWVRGKVWLVEELLAAAAAAT